MTKVGLGASFYRTVSVLGILSHHISPSQNFKRWEPLKKSFAARRREKKAKVGGRGKSQYPGPGQKFNGVGKNAEVEGKN